MLKHQKQMLSPDNQNVITSRTNLVFYINFQGNQVLKNECQQLFEAFDLLDEDQGKAFSKFLQSPFLVRNQRLIILFTVLYDSYKENALYLQGTKLLKKLFGRADLVQDEPRLKRDFKALEKNLHRFFAYQYLQDVPIEEYRLTAESHRINNKPAAFAKAINKWEKALSEQQRGDLYYLHQWLISHYSYFSLDSLKTLKDQHHFETVKQHFQQLEEFIKSVYSNEDISWQQTYDQDFSSNEVGNHSGDHSPLTDLYKGLIQLRSQNCFYPEEYQNLKDKFFFLEGKMDPIHHFVVWQLLMNFQGQLNRQTKNQFIDELVILVQYQLKNDLFAIFKQVPRELFLNNIKIALIAESPQLAQSILEKTGPKLAFSERTSTIHHAEIAILFYQRKHQLVVKKLRENFSRHQMEAYHDGLRLKSYRLRSMLYLTASSWDNYDEYEQASQDFERFLTRRKGKLAENQIKYYRQFFNHITQIFKAISGNDINRNLEKVKKSLKEKQQVHANQWMLDFIDQQLKA